VANVYLTYVLASFLYDKSVGLVSSLLVATNAGYVVFARFATSDILAIAVYTTTALVFSRAMLEENQIKRNTYLMITGLRWA